MNDAPQSWTPWIFRFGGGMADGNAAMRDLLGGKGANLAEMAKLGLPVPPGFTITTEVCEAYYSHDGVLPERLKAEMGPALKFLGDVAGARFGDPDNPLLVSVRSGAPASMPGMMDTVLNLGLNDETVEGMARQSGDARFAYDSYRRFIQMYADVVLGVDHGTFDDLLEHDKRLHGYEADTELDAADWQRVIGAYKSAIEEELGTAFPQDIREQLWRAVAAVFGSWRNARATTYRRLHNIPDTGGTAVTVQAMVFGNAGVNSATGVAFTRNPSTGEKQLYGEFLVNAQGEDVVAGLRTPQSLTEAARVDTGSRETSMETLMPDSFAELFRLTDRLERHYRDMQDIEFTIEDGTIWLLQTREGKRTTKAALKIAVDLTDEGVLSKEEAVLRIDPAQLEQILHPTLDPSAETRVIAKGLPASPGAASGEIVFDPDEAERLKSQGHKLILVRTETSPEDIHGMHAAAGILTLRGGMTSHAAVVARGMGRPCVSGANGLMIDEKGGTLTASGIVLRTGDLITIDGATGRVMAGSVPMIQPEMTEDFTTLMEWADSFARMGVRANAETPRDARQASDFGAAGIGLCRTEHMFFDSERIRIVREMILAADREGRESALARLLPMQRADFVELFRIMGDRPVTIRLLDPPLHEFLPRGEPEMREVAHALGIPFERIARRVAALSEFNPMLGHRGVRLAITYPEIIDMQARAIFEAAIEATAENVEIMVPLVALKQELDFVAERIGRVAERVREETGIMPPYTLGAMIELPRACLKAGELAETASFFSFGSNDLTQTVFGLSRDDSASFLGEYMSREMIGADPFASLDEEGVGEFIAIAVERGRKARPGVKFGICGEHGGDPASIDFCERIGLDYVSCSPFRVPVARLAAAQATLRREHRAS